MPSGTLVIKSENNFDMFVNRVGWFLIILFVSMEQSGFCNPGDSLTVRLSFKSKEITQANDLKMTLTINARAKQTVDVPAIDLWGLPSSVDGFYIKCDRDIPIR